MEYDSLAIERRAAESVGARVRRRRKELRLSQQALSRSAGINQGFLSQIECGKANPRRHTIDALAIALDLPLRRQSNLGKVPARGLEPPRGDRPPPIPRGHAAKLLSGGSTEGTHQQGNR